MDSPILLYNSNATEFSGRSFITMKNPSKNTEETLSFEEALADRNLRQRALSFYLNPPSQPLQIPLEFTQYVLRSLAITERGCRHFEKKLSPEVRKCLKGLIGRIDSDIEIQRVHSASTDTPSGFRGVFVKYFFKKVIYNLRNELGRYEYSENFATVFPFRVLQSVPVEYDIEVEDLLDDEFFDRIQTFLDHHFENADARRVGHLFLANIHHFRKTRLSEKDLIESVLRSSSSSNSEEGVRRNDYISSFPRLNEEGISWFKDLYFHYANVCKAFDDIDVSMASFDHDYFAYLPESNFADLYELLSPLYFKLRRETYIERFEKYLFFFSHALQEPPNPIFFIDDVLFECLKSLRRFKTSREDLAIVSDIAKLTLVHLRTKFNNEPYNTSDIYLIEPQFLQGIKEYVQNIPNIETARIDIEYRTDYLHGWMLLRNEDTCYEMCYSRRERRKIFDFVDRILCSVLAPDTEQIRRVVIYNSFRGEESSLEMPRDVQTIRNFVRLSNKYDFGRDTQAESSDEFLTKDIETYFDHLTIC